MISQYCNPGGGGGGGGGASIMSILGNDYHPCLCREFLVYFSSISVTITVIVPVTLSCLSHGSCVGCYCKDRRPLC